MSTYTYTASETFSLTNARRIASQVATDLLRFQTLYGSPSDEWIDKYEAEMIQLLWHDAVKDVVYGFKRDGKWTEAAIRYVALPGGTLIANDDPGKIRPRLDVAGAGFTSFLTYSDRWIGTLTPAERAAVERACGFQRASGSAPPLEAGYWADDRNYVSGGRGLGRSSVRRA